MARSEEGAESERRHGRHRASPSPTRGEDDEEAIRNKLRESGWKKRRPESESAADEEASKDKDKGKDKAVKSSPRGADDHRSSRTSRSSRRSRSPRRRDREHRSSRRKSSGSRRRSTSRSRSPALRSRSRSAGRRRRRHSSSSRKRRSLSRSRDARESKRSRHKSRSQSTSKTMKSEEKEKKEKDDDETETENEEDGKKEEKKEIDKDERHKKKSRRSRSGSPRSPSRSSRRRRHRRNSSYSRSRSPSRSRRARRGSRSRSRSIQRDRRSRGRDRDRRRRRGRSYSRSRSPSYRRRRRSERSSSRDRSRREANGSPEPHQHPPATADADPTATGTAPTAAPSTGVNPTITQLMAQYPTMSLQDIIAKMQASNVTMAAAVAQKPARELYVGNLPPNVTGPQLQEFLSTIIQQVGLTTQPGNPIINTWISTDGHFAFCEMRSVEECNLALLLNQLSLLGQPLKFGRPRSFMGPPQPMPLVSARTQTALTNLGCTPNPAWFAQSSATDDAIVESSTLAEATLAAVAAAQPLGGSDTGSAHRLIMSNIPVVLAEDQVKELVEPFGALKSFTLVKDTTTGASLGSALFEYEDNDVASQAVEGLNGLSIGGILLSVQRQPPSSGAAVVANPEDQPSAVLKMANMVSIDELKDDEEYADLAEDVEEECKRFGSVTGMEIPRPKDGEDVPGLGCIYVRFGKEENAVSALKALNGRKFGGNIVKVTYFPLDKFEKHDLSICGVGLRTFATDGRIELQRHAGRSNPMNLAFNVVCARSSSCWESCLMCVCVITDSLLCSCRHLHLRCEQQTKEWIAHRGVPMTFDTLKCGCPLRPFSVVVMKTCRTKHLGRLVRATQRFYR